MAKGFRIAVMLVMETSTYPGVYQEGSWFSKALIKQMSLMSSLRRQPGAELSKARRL